MLCCDGDTNFAELPIYHLKEEEAKEDERVYKSETTKPAKKNTITLNVDGHIFTSTWETLSKSAFLREKLEGLEDGCVPFIDRSARLFRLILDYLRNVDDLPEDIPPALRREAAHYGLDDLVMLLEKSRHEAEHREDVKESKEDHEKLLQAGAPSAHQV